MKFFVLQSIIWSLEFGAEKDDCLLEAMPFGSIDGGILKPMQIPPLVGMTRLARRPSTGV
jgi:hypothetical protein